MFTSKYNVMYVSYEDGDTKDVRVRIQQHTSVNGEGDKERERELSTLFAKPYLTAPHERNTPLSRHYVYYTMPQLKVKGEKEGMADSWIKL